MRVLAFKAKRTMNCQKHDRLLKSEIFTCLNSNIEDTEPSDQHSEVIFTVH